MNAKQVINQIRGLIRNATCDERELYEALVDLAEDWDLRLEEIIEEQEAII